ncbi:MAG: SulP family inorganic anion transporter [Deltaproteobacteria bacterium]|nr:SulP family inorganic anion transporter [Deltaproteobacteria bacterium]
MAEDPESPKGTLFADVVAGMSVALVSVPQALAYADLAGMPPVHGLYVAAMAPILAAPFVSSRYLQTGPTALTCLLTVGALATIATPYSDDYVGLAALLALLVGLARLLVGLLRMGAVAWIMSQPVLRGFTLAAALLIAGSQLPAALGAPATGQGVLARAGSVLMAPGSWTLGAVLLTVLTVALMRGGKYIHALFPGVLVAAVVGLGASMGGLPVGDAIGEIPRGLPPLNFSLPWASLPSLIVPGLVIALVGFAEPAAVARTFAAGNRERWNPDREFLSQGVANLVAGAFSGFPVGGSFSRSALAKVAGAKTWKAGAITGLFVLAVLPFAGGLAQLPRAILGATVLGAVIKLLDPRPMFAMWSQSKLQSSLAWATFAATLLTAPHVEYGVLIGIAVSLTVHLWREMSMTVPIASDGETLTMRPTGVLWFGTASHLEQVSIDALAEHPETKVLVVDLAGLGRIDFSGAEVLSALVVEARSGGVEVAVRNVPPQAKRIMGRFGLGASDEPER